MKRKWNNIRELCELITRDDTLDICGKDLKYLTYAPNLGYRHWIFSYKRTLVALVEFGDGHFDFHSAVSLLDLIVAKLYVFLKKE